MTDKGRDRQQGEKLEAKFRGPVSAVVLYVLLVRIL